MEDSFSGMPLFTNENLAKMALTKKTPNNNTGSSNKPMSLFSLATSSIRASATTGSAAKGISFPVISSSAGPSSNHHHKSEELKVSDLSSMAPLQGLAKHVVSHTGKEDGHEKHEEKKKKKTTRRERSSSREVSPRRAESSRELSPRRVSKSTSQRSPKSSPRRESKSTLRKSSRMSKSRDERSSTDSEHKKRFSPRRGGGDHSPDKPPRAGEGGDKRESTTARRTRRHVSRRTKSPPEGSMTKPPRATDAAACCSELASEEFTLKDASSREDVHSKGSSPRHVRNHSRSSHTTGRRVGSRGPRSSSSLGGSGGRRKKNASCSKQDIGNYQLQQILQQEINSALEVELEQEQEQEEKDLPKIKEAIKHLAVDDDDDGKSSEQVPLPTATTMIEEGADLNKVDLTSLDAAAINKLLGQSMHNKSP